MGAEEKAAHTQSWLVRSLHDGKQKEPVCTVSEVGGFTIAFVPLMEERFFFLRAESSLLGRL